MNLTKWLQYLKPNFKLYKDGFFECPYLANSPQMMIKSAIKTPTSKHVAAEQAIYRNNPFTKGVMRYREIETGFWITASNIDFKQNALIKTIYDEDFVSDYYTLTFTFFESQIKLQNTFEDKVPFYNKYWGFKKPATVVGAYFYKGSKCKFYIFSFSKEWIKNNLPFEELDREVPFKKFLVSNKGFITYQDIVPEAEKLSAEIWQSLESFNNNVFSKTILKSQSLNLVSTFFKNAFADERKQNYEVKDAIDYKKIAHCERLITANLTIPFLGIDAVAKAVNLSSTKLKMDFKLVYGTSMLQYNIDKKMNLAMQLIINTEMQIKNITQEVGYDSHSKFTATFKKKFGKLPSEVR
ncbi:AraC-type DNA-binding protein [Flavobacterium segetis]|uniref:AraC-type DNA-binding protein n=1 Tax=Flavobacterium segetis TaxID=271157 RepID=A0A1M5IK47_9FLAO|nr:AraC family transcriptional regulator [Flavobacterium segetis]SHG28734.1 AraC-type DNA-binding protein [Flavobacterium segetis]